MAGDPAKVMSPFQGISGEVYEAYLHAPEHLVAEVIDGELSLMPRPRPRHAKAATTLSGRLRRFYDPDEGDPGGWVILPEPELHLGVRPDIVDPDLAGWHSARLPEEPEEAAIKVVPDWVCEILSDSTEAIDRGKKRRVYQREGVRHYWICDPRIRTLEVYRLDNGRWIELNTYEGDVTVRAEPFDAIELELSRIWRWAQRP
jgi:Uma2 family endonuclease